MRRRRWLVVAVVGVALLLAAAWLWPREAPERGRLASAVASRSAPPSEPPSKPGGSETTRRLAESERERRIEGRPPPDRRLRPVEVPPEQMGGLKVVIRDSRGAIVDPVGVAMDGDCGRRRYSVTEGEGDVRVPAGRCTLVAWRRDGALRTMSEPVDVDVVAGGDVTAALVIPFERTGGIGVQIEEADDGVRVVDVLPGTPADEAGLRPGDVIVEVDGTPAALLSLSDFQSLMTGPEGTDVDFVLGYEGDSGAVEEPIVVTRTFLGG